MVLRVAWVLLVLTLTMESSKVFEGWFCDRADTVTWPPAVIFELVST